MILLGIWNNIIDFSIVKRGTFLVNFADSTIVCYANLNRKTLFLFVLGHKMSVQVILWSKYGNHTMFSLIAYTPTLI